MSNTTTQVQVRDLTNGQMIVVTLGDGTTMADIVGDVYPVDEDNNGGEWNIETSMMGALPRMADEFVTVVDL